MQIIDFKGFNSVNDFAKNGLNYAASEKINRLKDASNKPSIDIISDISNKFEDINLRWLLTGEGEMIRQSQGEVLEIPAKELVQISTESFVTRIMKMYSEGEIYSAAVVQKMMDEKNAKIEEKDAKIAELQKRVWELEQEKKNK